MRASRPARRVLGLVLAAVVTVTSPTRASAQPDAPLASARSAAQAALRDVFGPDAIVTLESPVLQLTPGATQVDRAEPEPSSRTNGPMRFVLQADGPEGPVRVGRLTATVHVAATHVRVTARVASRGVIAPDSVEVSHGDIGRQAIAPLPTLEEAAGATTRKPLMAGDVITATALVARPLVASGDEVVTVARVGAVEVRGRAIASQSGGLGDTVIVVNPDSRRRLHARVVGAALVEVGHGS